MKRLTTTTSDEDSDDGDCQRRLSKPRKKRPNKQMLLTKIVNRSISGYFNGNLQNQSNQLQLSSSNVLKFCLKDIIPFRDINDHIFMGLTLDGNVSFWKFRKSKKVNKKIFQFLLSYKRVCCENESVVNYDFNSGYKYELFFWIYRPHMPLERYVRLVARLIKIIFSFFSFQSTSSMTMGLKRLNA